nr:putative GH32 family protein a [Drusus annulatus]
MKHFKLITFIGLLLLCFHSTANADIQIKVNKPYLNIPVSHKVDRNIMTISVNGKTDKSFVIRLATDTPDYWVFADMTPYIGKTITLAYAGNAAGLAKISQSDKIVGSDSLYKEINRPQLHYTAQRGWNNDPNGLIYYEGEYHLFINTTPMNAIGRTCIGGHAVSTDLLHWKELPEALYPDANGTAFSGTCVIDYDNTSGFGTKAKPAMVVLYTAFTQEKQVQCLAYSIDKGRTWSKYKANPIIDSKAKWNSNDTRDPKVFWYKPTNKWVMVLNERDGHSIYNSTNSKDWTFESHITGFWECPELFELAIDGNKAHTLWVMYGASGTYMLGNFDGRKFTPVSGKHTYCNGRIYAAQTFANMPDTDGRRIQIGWGHIDHKGMPFQGQLNLPTELSLRTTPDGVRMFNNPIKEIDQLQQTVKQLVSTTSLTAEQANQLLQTYNNAGTLRIKTTFKLSHATGAGLNLFGQRIIDYDLNHNQLNKAILFTCRSNQYGT